jgi:5-methylthioadenosine/S-adenosylhomocysteine deaminase
MSSLLIKAGQILTMDPHRRVLDQGGILISGSTIARVLDRDELVRLEPGDAETLDATSMTVIPGFVQTHVHLCQSLFRGLAEDLDLLDWLREYIFPLEAAHTDGSIDASARVGLTELIGSGTTTIMDMGSIHHQDALGAAVEQSGIRAVVGKSLMDRNDLYAPLCESTGEALRSTRALMKRWHNAAQGRIRYAVAPRFVLSCTDELLREAHAIASEHAGVLFHTHAAENPRELEAVRSRCGMDNIEYFAHLGILDEWSCLAHCVWVSERERGLMAERGAKVLHCPSANLKLGSGLADVPALLGRGITVSIGADGAPCNNTLDMFHEMRLASQLQKPGYTPHAMDARSVLELATRGGAEALGLSSEIGSLEEGKQADLVLLDMERIWNPLHQRDPYAAIVHSGSPENVRSVMVGGTWLYRDGALRGAAAEDIRRVARDELAALLKRASL